MKRYRVRLLLTLLVWGAVVAFAQNPEVTGPPPQPPLPRPQFFAGTVTGLDEQHVTISRALVGRAPETRTFQINGKTKWNKVALKVKARVTVRYQHLPEGDLALEIQIHPPSRASRPS